MKNYVKPLKNKGRLNSSFVSFVDPLQTIKNIGSYINRRKLRSITMLSLVFGESGFAYSAVFSIN